ncbi:MAG TPA: hypothetical protein VIY86_13155, partial [Pirellulaceae bacterium]
FNLRIVGPDSLLGDFNGDHVRDAIDIDLLGEALQQGNDDPYFDLNGDTQVDFLDVDMLVRDLMDTNFGDANLDGFVDGSDFNVWNMHKFMEGGWGQGDFSSDGIIDGSDFNLWNIHKFQGPARAWTGIVPWVADLRVPKRHGAYAIFEVCDTRKSRLPAEVLATAPQRTLMVEIIEAGHPRKSARPKDAEFPDVVLTRFARSP